MATTDTALEGLDALEQPRAGSGNGASSLAARAWRATWPKLAAIALVLVIWEVIAASGWKKLIFPAPGPTLANLWDQLGTGLLWHAIGTTLYRALIGFALALVIGSVIGAVVSRVRPLRAAVAAAHRAADDAVNRLVPVCHHLVRADHAGDHVRHRAGRRAVGRQRPHRRGGLHPAAAAQGRPHDGAAQAVAVPARHHPGVAPGVRGRPEAGLGVRLAVPDGGRALVVIANQPSLGVLLQTDQDQADMASATAIIIVILVIGIVVDSVFSTADRSLRRRWGLA